MPVPMEPHFFSTDIKFRSSTTHYRNEQEYMGLFDGADAFRWRREASVWYLYSSVAAENIYKFDPQASILCMILCRMPHTAQMLRPLVSTRVRQANKRASLANTLDQD